MTSNFLFSALARLAVLVFLTTLPACGKQSDSVVAIALHPTKSNIVYVATNEAVYKTRDSGVTWYRLPTFSARRVTTLAIDPQFPATVYSGTMGDAVYKSPDGGQRWLPHNVGLKEHVS
ncbi:MAG: WD40/YVTN/BNR-like repeat-containing protein, partial [Nitrospiraceae bacterium]